MCVYNDEIEKQILSLLDGWVKIESDSDNQSNNVEPFINEVSEYKNNPNKKVTEEELTKYYNLAYDKSLLYCNRLNIDDLTEIERKMFIKGVCYITASDLWNKYNIRVSNEDMEDTYVSSYGGLLYKQGTNTLNNFINQRIYGLISVKKDSDKNRWII